MERNNPRLAALLACIQNCDCLCDIGTDHAYLPIFAVQHSTALRAIASDVKPGPLKIAAQNIAAAGLAAKISVIQSDGFCAFHPGDFDVAVIAGMGGHLITDILATRPAVARACSKLILQPMMDIPYCREWLFQNKFDIIDEVLAVDEHRIYVIMTVVPVTTKVAYALEDSLIGPILKLKTDPHFGSYVDKLMRRRKKRLAGLCVSVTKESLAAFIIVKKELELLQKLREKG